MSKEQVKGNFLSNHPYLSQAILSYGVGLIITLLRISMDRYVNPRIFADTFLFSFIVALFFVYPVVVTCYQFILLLMVLSRKKKIRLTIRYDVWTLCLAGIYEFLYLTNAKEAVFSADWQQQLVNAQMHTPIHTDYQTSIALFLVVCMIGLFILWMRSVNELPPLITVLCISCTYLGVIFMVVWTIQIFTLRIVTDLYLLLPTLVFITIVIKTIAIKIRAFHPDPNRLGKINAVPILNRLNRFLMNAKRWPFMAFVLLLPLLVMIMLVLILWGQSPDAGIKAFTETSDWNLSQKVSPQNIYYDEHYLCTVAAGGHKKIVNPIRMGVRHNHFVVVNRQLLIANAFEQILEEKLPGTHKIIRNVYDTYGFPVARVIQSKWMADCIWILMKPFEWLFLATLYLCDPHPEDRIAIQYTGKTSKDFL